MSVKYKEGSLRLWFGRRGEAMTRKEHLEQMIRDSLSLIVEYGRIQQTTNDPREQLRVQRSIADQSALVNQFVAEYRPIAGESVPPDLAGLLNLPFPLSSSDIQAAVRARDAESVENLLGMAARAELQGDLAGALSFYRQARQLDPLDPRIQARMCALDRELAGGYTDRDGKVIPAMAMRALWKLYGHLRPAPRIGPGAMGCSLPLLITSGVTVAVVVYWLMARLTGRSVSEWVLAVGLGAIIASAIIVVVNVKSE
jgi:hypothetical protein